jgi:hypothetical protein
MVPVLPPGTVVYGWRWFHKVKPQSVVIALHDLREVVKRVDHIENDKLYLLGDHAETSTDSRHYGLVPMSEIESIVVWPRTRRVLAEQITSYGEVN